MIYIFEIHNNFNGFSKVTEISEQIWNRPPYTTLGIKKQWPEKVHDKKKKKKKMNK